jgi:hypothetical protein
MDVVLTMTIGARRGKLKTFGKCYSVLRGFVLSGNILVATGAGRGHPLVGNRRPGVFGRKHEVPGVTVCTLDQVSVDTFPIGENRIDIFVDDMLVHEFPLPVARKAGFGVRELETVFRVATKT